MLYDLCCIGHITIDDIVTPHTSVTMPGGTAFYFSHAVASMPVRYLLVTAVAETERNAVEDLRATGVAVRVLPSDRSVHFENRYGENSDQRTQRVLQKAAPFNVSMFADAEARIFHLGPLLADDFSATDIQLLATKGKVSLDVQGFLRRVENEAVVPVDWEEKIHALPSIHFLKANEEEMTVLTGTSDIRMGAKTLAAWGVREVIITLGSKGSVVYDGKHFYNIPAYRAHRVQDATGCGDTYMAGYLFQRSKGTGIQQAGCFAAAMATLKIEVSGPFTGTEKEVEAVTAKNDVLADIQSFSTL